MDGGTIPLNWQEISKGVARRLAQRYGIEAGEGQAASEEEEDLRAFLTYLDSPPAPSAPADTPPRAEEGHEGLAAPETALPDEAAEAGPEVSTVDMPEVGGTDAVEEAFREPAFDDVSRGEPAPDVLSDTPGGGPATAGIEAVAESEGEARKEKSGGFSGLVFLPLDEGDDVVGEKSRDEADSPSEADREDPPRETPAEAEPDLVMDVPEDMLSEEDGDGEDGVQFVPL